MHSCKERKNKVGWKTVICFQYGKRAYLVISKAKMEVCYANCGRNSWPVSPNTGSCLHNMDKADRRFVMHVANANYSYSKYVH